MYQEGSFLFFIEGYTLFRIEHFILSKLHIFGMLTKSMCGYTQSGLVVIDVAGDNPVPDVLHLRCYGALL